MADDLKNYKPTGKGRPPLDPKKLKLWKQANKALHERNEGAESAATGAQKVKKKKVKKSPTKKAAAVAREAPSDRGEAITPGRIRKNLATGRKAAKDKAPRVYNITAGPFIPNETLDNPTPVLSDNHLHDIIALCKKEGIRRLKIAGAFDIELSRTSTGPQAEPVKEPVPVEGATASPALPTTQAQGSDPSALDDIDETQQLIDDPAGWEQSQIDAHTRAGAVSAESEDRRAESDLRGSGFG